MKSNRRCRLAAFILCTACILSSCGGNGTVPESGGAKGSVSISSEPEGNGTSGNPSGGGAVTSEEQPSGGQSSGSSAPGSSGDPLKAGSKDSSTPGGDGEASGTQESSGQPSGKAEMPAPDFLTAEQQETYRRAKAAFYCFNMSTFGIDYLDNPTSSVEELEAAQVTLEGNVYYKAKGTMQSYQAFQEYMLSVFTPAYLEELNSRPAFVSVNGELYHAEGDRGSNITRDNEPDTFALIKESDDRIEFNVQGTYYSLKQQEEIDQAFNDTTATASETESKLSDDFWQEWWSQWKGEETQSFPVVMVKTKDGWRFSKFSLTY